MAKRMLIGLLLGLLVAAGPAPGAEDVPPVDRHVIYVHGWIIQDRQDPRPEHPEFGFYELEEILEAFRARGFEVVGEVRPKDATIESAADRVVAQVDSLMAAGVSADRITVVGASMGAGIALVASARLGDPDVRFAVLGTCLSLSIPRALEQEGRPLTGRILSIREASDRVTANCPPLEDDPEPVPEGIYREILLETGLDHGFFYRPRSVWFEPVVEWATRED